jgi:DNA-directed RNA polymerase alpha subunit
LHKTDLLKQRNFGKKSLIELDDFLEDRGLSFGMDVDRIYRERIMERIEDEDMKQALQEGNQI